MPTGKVKWFSLEKGFGFIESDEGEDVYLAATSLPEGVTTVRPGTKLEFGVAEGRRGPQALSVRVIEAPTSLAASSRAATDDLASIIEDSIKILDRVGNSIRRGKYPTAVEAQRLGKVLRGIAQQIEDNA